MPNHIHGIIILTHPRTGESCIRPDSKNPDSKNPDSKNPPDSHPSGHVGDHKDRPYENTTVDGRPRGTSTGSLGRIVQAFKSIATHKYTQGVKHNDWPPFAGRLWLRNYYDHVIRNDDALDEIRRYIVQNPICWANDKQHPSNQTTGEPDDIHNL